MSHYPETAATMIEPKLTQPLFYKDQALAQTIMPDQYWAMLRQAISTVHALESKLSESEKLNAQKDTHIQSLQKLATHDELTGLANRRGFMEILDKELVKTSRDVSQGGLLVMIDLDNFKLINDTYGHKAGDEALILVAQTLQAHIRRMDCAARLGGDEFILIFPNAHKIEIAARLQKLIRRLNTLHLKHEGEIIPIRASLGTQSYQRGDKITTILNGADESMYQNKEHRKYSQESKKSLVDA